MATVDGDGTSPGQLLTREITALDSSSTAWREALRPARTIVFLCSGNMVRSAFAELYARHLGCPKAVRSAATIYRNRSIYPETARALAAYGVPVESISSFRPTHCDDLLPTLGGSVVFFGMQRHHLDAMRPWPEHHARCFLLAASREIADPVLEDADFAATFAHIASCVEDLIGQLAD